MRTKRLLKASRLVELGACPGQVKLFRKLWGEQVYVTVPRMFTVAYQFLWDWGAEYLLSAPAGCAYEEARAPAQRAHQEAIATAWRAYDEATAPAFAVAYINDMEG